MFLLTSFYWEKFISSGTEPRVDCGGQLAITKRLPEIAVQDIGRCACGIFRRGGDYADNSVGIAGQHLSGSEMAAAFTRVLGVPVSYRDISPGAYRTFGYAGAKEHDNMFQFKRDFNEDFCGKRSVAESRQLNPELLSFDEWLAINASPIP